MMSSGQSRLDADQAWGFDDNRRSCASPMATPASTLSPTAAGGSQQGGGDMHGKTRSAEASSDWHLPALHRFAR
ncbi:unnamed protein product, partial [Ascophyllum nodosum]